MIDVQEKSPGEYQLSWESEFGEHSISVSASTNPLSTAEKLLSKQAIGCADFSGLSSGRRHYFRLEDQNGRQRIAATRNLPLGGAVNFRDLGGYEIADGRYTKWGAIFRSGHLSELSRADQDYLSNLDIRTVCDFRREIEIKNEASLIPGSPRIHNVEIIPGARDPNHIQQLFAGTEEPEDVVDAMIEIMRTLITDAAPQYKKLFELLLEHNTGAFLMNCSAGKERTGVGVALVLMALGASRDTIKYDFMLSGKYYPIEREVPRVFEKYDVKLRGDAGRRLVMPLLEARDAYIQVVFDEIDKRYYSDEAFIREVIGLGDRELKHLRESYGAVA